MSYLVRKTLFHRGLAELLSTEGAEEGRFMSSSQ
jgi:hypothetical protein